LRTRAFEILFEAHKERGREKYPDWDTVVSAPDLPITEETAEFFLMFHNAEDIVYHFCTHQDELRQLSDMDIDRRIVYIARVSTMLINTRGVSVSRPPSQPFVRVPSARVGEPLVIRRPPRYEPTRTAPPPPEDEIVNNRSLADILNNRRLAMMPPRILSEAIDRDLLNLVQDHVSSLRDDRRLRTNNHPPDSVLQEARVKAEKKIAESAMKLLESKIGAKKFNSLKTRGYFNEKCKYGTLRFGWTGVVLRETKTYGTKSRVLSWTLCVQTVVTDLPAGDVILARWMAWKADEDKFFDTANFRSVKTIDEAIDRTGPTLASMAMDVFDNYF
jgi:hypothetical protein